MLQESAERTEECSLTLSELAKDSGKGSGGSRSQIECVNLQAGRRSFMQLGHERKGRVSKGLA